jgi:hypothetical protein
MRNTSIFWFTASAVDKIESQYRERAQVLRGLAEKDHNIKRLVDTWGASGQETEFVKVWMLTHEEWILVMDSGHG